MSIRARSKHESENIFKNKVIKKWSLDNYDGLQYTIYRINVDFAIEHYKSLALPIENIKLKASKYASYEIIKEHKEHLKFEGEYVIDNFFIVNKL